MSGVASTTTYTYDATGNRLTKVEDEITTSYTYDANDRLTTDGSLTYSYDNNGNTLSIGTKTYTYDSKNRLATFINGTTSISYTYDTSNKRTSKTVNNLTTNYLYCQTCQNAKVIEELDETGNLEKSYIYGNNILGTTISGIPYGYITDGHGSVRKMTTTGTTVAEYDYNAYGEITEETGSMSSSNDFRYTGEQYDLDLDQYYLRARYYNQNIGRFQNMDTWQGSLSNPTTLNKYIYGNANPVMNVDPSGHFGIMQSMAAMSSNYIMAMTAIPVISGFIVGCSYTESNEVLIARNVAVANLGRLVNELKYNISPGKLTNALGMYFTTEIFHHLQDIVFIESTSNILSEQYSIIKSGLEGTSKKDFIVLSEKDSEEDTVANVNAEKELPIVLHKSWWKYTYTSNPSRDGAIIHEASHVFIKTTDEGGYYDEVFNVANESFYKALDNADNYRLLYEYWF